MRRSTSVRSHNEWVSLLDISGPFLSNRILEQTFPNGLDTVPAELRTDFRLAYEEWLESRDPRLHSTWVEWVLSRLLEYDEDVLGKGQRVPEKLAHEEPEHRETVRPHWAVLDPDDETRVLLPVLMVPRDQRLGTAPAHSRWSAPPTQRMQALLRSTGTPIGLVTNGSEWCLVHCREGETTGYITFRADLLADEPILLQAFVSLLGVRRVLGAADGQRLHELLLASRDDEEELTLDLGKQVRQAVELLVREIDLLDAAADRGILAAIPEEQRERKFYHAALTVMMRLMFLLCAEERKLLPLTESETYNAHYAASSLLSQLEQEASAQGEEILERRHDAWTRLLATARLVHQGSVLPELQMTAYGGSLFDPTSFPFLERLRVNNRIVLHMLESLQYILAEGPTGKERRRISFEALDVEQIGYVYEGLLDHEIRKATGYVLGLVGKPTYEPELALSDLERAAASGRKVLVKLLKEETDRTDRALERLLDTAPDEERERALTVACGGNTALLARLRPFANLIRADSLGRLQVYPPDSYYVTNSDERRGTGTHYTPRFLAEEMVQYALEPLVYEGPAEGRPRPEWKLRSPAELVGLRVADIAMGSGAFLVAVCRYLAERLNEAWTEAETVCGMRLVFTPRGELRVPFDPKSPDRSSETQVDTPIGPLLVADPKDEALPLDPEERQALARRTIADRCLYGVDINPMAAEMAKLSLWLITMRRDRPFTFLDHALKCGDSLVGVTLSELKAFSLDSQQLGSLLVPWVPDAVEQVAKLRQAIRDTPTDTDLHLRERMAFHEKAEEQEAALRVAADLLLAEAFQRTDRRAHDQRLAQLQTKPTPEETTELGSVLGRSSFHFELEFADVFAEGGFDAVVGNPPFVGGQKIRASMGSAFRDYLVRRVAGGVRGSADLCAYFFLRAVRLLRNGGYIGYLATNTLSEGDTREVGLDQLLLPVSEDQLPKCTALRAVKSTKWPSKSANLQIAKIWLRNGSWNGDQWLDGRRAAEITPYLADDEEGRKPQTLVSNAGLSFQGSIVLGMGFVLAPSRAQDLLGRDGNLKDVLFPYLNGEDLNSTPDQSPNRWVINFHNWPLGRVGQKLPCSGEEIADAIRRGGSRLSDDWYPRPNSRWDAAGEERQAKWLQLGLVPDDYPGPVAADYPECLFIVERFVRAERERLASGDSTARDRARRWWQFARPTIALYAAIRPLPRCLARARVSQYHSFAWVPTDIVVSEQTVVIADSHDATFATVQSTFHQVFTERNASSLETRQRYTPSDCFETFPLPDVTEALDEAGKRLDEVRRAAMVSREIGLTALAQLIHRPTANESDIQVVREAIVLVDEAVRAAYGWDDLPMEHGFYGEGRACRFSASPKARTEMLRRLMRLNRRRYEEENSVSLNGAKEVAEKRAVYNTPITGGLFGSGDWEEVEA